MRAPTCIHEVETNSPATVGKDDFLLVVANERVREVIARHHDHVSGVVVGVGVGVGDFLFCPCHALLRFTCGVGSNSVGGGNDCIPCPVGTDTILNAVWFDTIHHNVCFDTMLYCLARHPLCNDTIKPRGEFPPVGRFHLAIIGKVLRVTIPCCVAHGAQDLAPVASAHEVKLGMHGCRILSAGDVATCRSLAVAHEICVEVLRNLFILQPRGVIPRARCHDSALVSP
mmetsp:Transcript_28890/g.72294  ORF Transcript_28890/g.72294 Transcript_28890/m.72294 type:complete len:228 (+) Transcript_28890:1956-2639(+)